MTGLDRDYRSHIYTYFRLLRARKIHELYMLYLLNNDFPQLQTKSQSESRNAMGIALACNYAILDSSTLVLNGCQGICVFLHGGDGKSRVTTRIHQVGCFHSVLRKESLVDNDTWLVGPMTADKEK